MFVFQHILEIINKKYESDYTTDNVTDGELELDEVTINLDEPGRTFTIYYSYSYYDDGTDSVFIMDAVFRDVIAMGQFVYDKVGIKPTINTDDSYQMRIGYYNLDVDIEEIMFGQIIDALRSVEEVYKLDYHLLVGMGLETFKGEFDNFSFTESIIELLKNYGFERLRSLWPPFSDHIDVSESSKDYVLSTRSKNTIIGFPDASATPDVFLENLGGYQKLTRFYMGNNLFLGEANNELISVPYEKIKLFDHILDLWRQQATFHRLNVSYHYGRRFLFIISEYVWIIIGRREHDLDNRIVYEYDELINLAKKLRPFMPEKNRYSIDWSVISPGVFEDLCQELLELLGYTNVKKIGKTNAPDGGRDIEATQVLTNLVNEPQERKWIFQCKHKKSITKNDLLGISDIMDDFEAQGYGLLCTCDLAPSAVDRLNRVGKKDKHKTVTHWTGNDLERSLEKFPDLLQKYRLI